MIDLGNITYRLVILAEDGQQYNIKDLVQELTWEENEKEIAVRISFTARNAMCADKLMSAVAKLGRLVGVFATVEGTDQEVARGTLVDWKPSWSASAEKLACKAYDELYNLQQSEDNLFYAAGASTRTVICQIFENWEIPLRRYEGPDISHGQLAYKSDKLSDIILDLLEEAKEKGGEECVVRAEMGQVSVLPVGNNTTIWCFQVDNLISASQSLSTTGMVTRVKVIGQADDEGKSSVEAVLNGQTQYGVRQKLYTREKDGSLAEAQAEAQKILDEDGILQEEITIQSPDIPFIRKMDLVYVRALTMDSYYYVLSVQHNADSGKMTLTLKKAETQTVTETAVTPRKEYNVGDLVNFHGGQHYVSSYPEARGYSAAAGRAKITIKNGSGQAHPWHLVTENWDETRVWGWVDDGSFD